MSATSLEELSSPNPQQFTLYGALRNAKSYVYIQDKGSSPLVILFESYLYNYGVDSCDSARGSNSDPVGFWAKTTPSINTPYTDTVKPPLTTSSSTTHMPRVNNLEPHWRVRVDGDINLIEEGEYKWCVWVLVC